jgi:hypothetical protein
MSEGDSVRQSFVYDAFISYRHVDRDIQWAEWLVDSLEQYRIPKALQKRGLSKRLLKVFRDENEFSASADINDQVKEALAASRFLIVICSAFTPRSRWVRREIEIFNELGRGDQVLALLTEGEPHDSFPSHMLERYRQAIRPDGTVDTLKEGTEPLAADVRPRPGVSDARRKRLALLRLVAPILGVNFDDLQQRERERERTRRTIWASVAAGIILLTAAGGFSYWELARPKTTYYDQVVFRWGIPEGLDPLDEEAHSHASESYRLLTHHGKVLDVRREASGGTLKENDSGVAHWVIRYGADDRVTQMQSFNANDRLIREAYFERGSSSNSLIISFKRDKIDLPQTSKLVSITHQMETMPDITRHELTLSDLGYTIKTRYQNHYGVPQHDASGSYGQNFTYSPEGLLLREAWVGLEGKEIILKNGVRANSYVYDSRHNRERTTLLDSNDKPFDGPNGYAYSLSKYDRWGNEVSTEYYSAAGSPVNPLGSWKVTRTYDNRGNQIERAYYSY